MGRVLQLNIIGCNILAKSLIKFFSGGNEGKERTVRGQRGALDIAIRPTY